MSQNQLENEFQPPSSIPWPNYFFGMMASIRRKSKDVHTQFGCIITGPDHEIRSTGYNSFPRGLNDSVAERYARPEKYFWMEHAERNAIYNAARMGTPLNGCTIFIDALPCGDCARGIIQVGIKELFYDMVKWEQFLDSRKTAATGMKSWVDDIYKAVKMLEECGVKITPFTS